MTPSLAATLTPGVRAQVFYAMLRAEGIVVPVPEFKFCETRRWRFDYAFPASMVAVEVEGGAWSGGRHTRGAGFIKDLAKYSEAAALGWRLIRCTPQQLATPETVGLIKRALSYPVANFAAKGDTPLSE